MNRLSCVSACIVVLLGSGAAFAQDAPIGLTDNYDIRVGETLTVAAPGVLENDLGGAVSAELAADYTTGLGDLTFNPDGSFTFTLTYDGFGEGDLVTFFYRALNGSGGASADTAVLMTVREDAAPAPDPGADPPAAVGAVGAPLFGGDGLNLVDNENGDHAINDTLCGGTIGAPPMTWWPLAFVALAFRPRRRGR